MTTTVGHLQALSSETLINITKFLTACELVGLKRASKACYELIFPYLIGSHLAQDPSEYGQKQSRRLFAFLYPLNKLDSQRWSSELGKKTWEESFFTSPKRYVNSVTRGFFRWKQLSLTQVSSALLACNSIKLLNKLETLKYEINKFAIISPRYRYEHFQLRAKKIEEIWSLDTVGNVFKKLTSVKELNISLLKDEGSVFHPEFLTQITCLEHLHIDSIPYEDQTYLNFLPKMISLTRLTITLLQQTLAFVNICNLTNLTELCLEGDPKRNLNIHSYFFSRLTSLQKLELISFDVEESTLKYLGRLTALTDLKLRSYGISGNQFAGTFSKLTKLKILSLSCGFYDKPDRFTEALKKLTNLTHFVLFGWCHSNLEDCFAENRAFAGCPGQLDINIDREDIEEAEIELEEAKAEQELETEITGPPERVVAYVVARRQLLEQNREQEDEEDLPEDQ